MPRPAAFSGKGKRQRFYARTAVKTTLYRDAQAIDAIKNSSRADRLLPTDDAACWRTSAYLGVPAPLVIVGTRLQDELLEKTETYRTFRHSERQQFAAGRRNAENPVAERESCLASRYPRKIQTTWRASVGWVCQGAGFHATFSLAAALCDAVWPNRPSNDVPAAAKMTPNRKWRSGRP
jgi:hypothetical protein